jgi:hypothetical protein
VVKQNKNISKESQKGTPMHTNKNVLKKTNEAKTTLGLFTYALYSLYLIKIKTEIWNKALADLSLIEADYGNVYNTYILVHV